MASRALALSPAARRAAQAASRPFFGPGFGAGLFFGSAAIHAGETGLRSLEYGNP